MAPHAIDLECTSVLRRLTRKGILAEEKAADALDVLRMLDMRRFEHASLLPRIWELRHNMWPYDAAFIALAEYLNISLVTVDKKFDGVPGTLCRIRNLHA